MIDFEKETITPETLAELYEIDKYEKPARVIYDADIDAHFCPYCGCFVDDQQIEQIRCQSCKQLLAWY